jgi:hypothetical protein
MAERNFLEVAAVSLAPDALSAVVAAVDEDDLLPLALTCATLGNE